MARQVRIQYPRALHHVRARGNGGQPIFLDDRDRRKFLELLAEAIRHYGWLLYAWVLMTNHVHFVIETPQPNLSEGMQWLLSVYVEWFNKRHRCTGHLFGDRFHSDLIEKESYFRDVVAYIVLNPVRAHMVERPEEYRWSSYRATAGLERAPEWLALGELAPHFGEPATWQANYRALVAGKMVSGERLWDKLVNQIYLGSETWIKEIRKRVESKMRSDVHPRAQREVGRPKMAAIVAGVASAFGVTEAWIRSTHGGAARLIAAWLGWYEGLQRLRSIAAALRLRSSGRVSGLVAECERMLKGNRDLQTKVDLALAAIG